MAVSVQHDGFTVTSTAGTNDEVIASLQAADAASQETKPADSISGAVSTPSAQEVVAKPAETTATAPSESTEANATAEEPEPPQPRAQNGQFRSAHKKGSLQYRMDQKTWQANEALRTLEAERQQRQQLQQRLEALERGQQPAPRQERPSQPQQGGDRSKPTINDVDDHGQPKYATYEDFSEDLADWKIEQKLKVRDEQAQQQQFMAERAKLGNEFQTRRAEFAKTVADFEEVVNTDDISLSPVMCEALVTSAHGPAIAYYLGKHPEEAFRLMQESQQIPVSAAPLMRRDLEARATTFLGDRSASSASPAQTIAVVRQAAPAPIKPVGSGLSVADTAPDDLPFGPDYVERMNKRDLDRFRAKQGR